MNKGKFIVIEGQGFTGKTTQANLLVQKLKESGIDAVSVRHPGGSIHAEKYRQQLLEKKAAGVLTPDEELELLMRALKSLVDELILPALESGKWVVLTRFIPSAIVYQGYQEGLDKDFIEVQGKKASQNLNPDLSILIDLDEDEILERKKKAGETEIHAYNDSDKEILKTRREGYLEIFKNLENSVIIDGSKPREENAEKIWEVVSSNFQAATSEVAS